MRPRITSAAFSYTAPNSVASGPRFRQVVHDSVSTEKLDRFPTESWTTSNGILDRFPWNHWTTSTGIRKPFRDRKKRELGLLKEESNRFE
jgi:hypothetical protein